jgi:hypothetical protein
MRAMKSGAMKSIALLIVAASFTLQAQTPAADQASESTTAATAATRVAAEFTKKIDTKDAKVGDEVAARTTADARLADGTDLPRGTRLTGTVTSVHAKSGEEKTAHLAFNFNRAVLQDGKQIPLHVTLTSLSAVGQMPAAGSDPMTPNVGGTGGGRVSASSVTGMGGGLSGGTSGMPGGRGSKSGAAANTAGTLDPNATAAVPVPVRTGHGDPRAEGSPANGNYVSDALAVHHYPVANMPGVVLSSQATASVSGSVDANGQNIRLDSGTKMTMNASVVGR